MAPDAVTDEDADAVAGGGTHEDENGACSEKLSVDDRSPPPPMLCAFRRAAASDAECWEFAVAFAFALVAVDEAMFEASDAWAPVAVIELPRALPEALAPTPNAAASLSVICSADSGRGARLTNRSNTSPEVTAAAGTAEVPEDAPLWALMALEGRLVDTAAPDAIVEVVCSTPDESVVLAFSAEF